MVTASGTAEEIVMIVMVAAQGDGRKICSKSEKIATGPLHKFDLLSVLFLQ